MHVVSEPKYLLFNALIYFSECLLINPLDLRRVLGQLKSSCIIILVMRSVLFVSPFLLMLLVRLLLVFLRFLFLLLILIACELFAGKSLVQSKVLRFGKMNQFFEALGEDVHVERVLGAIKRRDVVQTILQCGNVFIEGCASGLRLKLIDSLVE
jgi:hypothetical protein